MDQNQFIKDTNNDLRTFQEYKDINASWKAGFDEFSGGESLWAEFQLINTAIKLTNIAPIIFFWKIKVYSKFILNKISFP